MLGFKSKKTREERIPGPLLPPVFRQWQMWEHSAYCREMKRRKQYYENTQLYQELTENLPTSNGGDGVDPSRVWASTWQGPGWEDLVAMLPDACEAGSVYPVTIPMTSVIIDNRAVAYSIPVKTRNILKDEKPDEKQSKLWNRILDGANHGWHTKQFCRWVDLFDTAFQFVGYNEKEKSLTLRNLGPHQVYAYLAEPTATHDIQDPGVVVAVRMEDTEVTNYYAKNRNQDWEPVWQVWYQDKYWYETTTPGRWTDPSMQEHGVVDNPYRNEDGDPIKPIVARTSTPVDTIYHRGSDNVVNLNQRADRNQTALAHTMEHQGFSVPVIFGLEPEEIEARGWGAGAPFHMPTTVTRNEGGIDFAHPVIQVAELSSTMDNFNRLALKASGVDADFLDPDHKVQSGVSSAQQRLALAEKRDQQFPDWWLYERELLYIAARVWNSHIPENKLAKFKLVEIPRKRNAMEETDYRVETVFGELDPVVDPLADSLTHKNNIEMGLYTAAHVIASVQRVSLKRAQEMHDEWDKYNKKYEKEKEVLGGKPPRIGQNGNRPEKPEKEKNTGDNATVGRGNNTIERG